MFRAGEVTQGNANVNWISGRQSINYETAILRNTASIEHTPEALGVETLRDVRFGGTWARDVQ